MEESVNPNMNPNKSELGNLSFRDLFYKYVRFMPLFIISVAVGLLGSYLYLRYKVPVFRAGGTLLIKSTQNTTSRGDKVDELLGGNSSQNIQSEMEILKSRPLMLRVVKALRLEVSYYALGRVKTINIYKQSPFLVNVLQLADSSRTFIFKVKILNEQEFKLDKIPTNYRFGQEFKNSNGIFRIDNNGGFGGSNLYKVVIQPASAAAGGYASAIQVMPKSAGTGILNISMTTLNPLLGSDIINRLMEEYSDYTLEEKQRSSDLILVFINGRLKDIGAKLDSVQQLYLQYQRKYNLIDATTQSGNYFNIISESDKTINEQSLMLNVAGMIDEYLADKKNEFTRIIVPTTLGLDDATLNELVGGYNKAQLARKQLLDGNVPAANPSVKELDGQIEKLRVSIRENLRNIKSANNAVINRNRKMGGEGETQLRAMPEKVKELAEINRQIETYQGLYKLFTEKKEETAISRVSAIPNSEIIDRSFPSGNPISPNRKTIQIMAILLGLALPALFIFAAEVLNDKVSTRFDVEKLTEAPILGEIGHSYSNTTLIVSKTTRSMVAEQFRIIRANLQYILHKKQKAIILVTSSFSGEGKSYISTNMGAVMALAGKKTIILEFDIRKPKIISGLGIAKGPGITNFLVGKGNLPDLIKPIPDYENLFVLGCGPIPPNPSELLLDPKMDELFSWLSQNFEIVIVDTAPVGMVSDAMTLGRFADSTLYLVRQGHTFKKQVALIDDFYKEKKLPKVSIIINDVKLKTGYGYYGYGRYGYGYGYGYGSYYEEEAAPANFIERILGLFDIRKFFRKKRKKR